MKEILTANGVNYTVEDVRTGINTISFKIIDPVPDDVEAAFKAVKTLTIGDKESDIAYGEYPNVEYESLTIKADGSIIVSMHIPTKIEKQLNDLQASQLDQDEAIAEALYGGGGVNE